jgi:hypothetical protein
MVMRPATCPLRALDFRAIGTPPLTGTRHSWSQRVQPTTSAVSPDFLMLVHFTNAGAPHRQ